MLPNESSAGVDTRTSRSFTTEVKMPIGKLGRREVVSQQKSLIMQPMLTRVKMRISSERTEQIMT